jgi:uncharacterized protein YjdB
MRIWKDWAIAAIVVFGLFFTGCETEPKETGGAVTSVRLNPTELSLEVGGQGTLTATVQPANAANKTVSWSSSNKNVATVDNGTVTAVSAGTATITVTSNSDPTKTATCAVTVISVPVESVTLNKNTLELIIAESGTLTATVQPPDATNKNLRWSSSNPAVATVTNGTVNALAEGTADITVTSAGNPDKTDTCAVTVTGLDVGSVSLDKSALTLYIGYTVLLTPTVLPAGARNKNVTWSSGDPAVATVTDGTVTAVAAGTAIITAASVEDGNKTATCNVTVSLISMVSIEPGTFMMGSPANEPERGLNVPETLHQVTLTQGFYMGAYTVTQEQYETVTGRNPSYFDFYEYSEDFPVETVTWFDAVDFCNKLSVKDNLTPVYTITGISSTSGGSIYEATVTPDWNANGYRLPTEAEWEYACRAGTTTPFNTGDNITTHQANYDGDYPYNGNYEDGRIYWGHPIPGWWYEEHYNGSPNAWGLYAMHGNVEEWCWDWYGGDYSQAVTDPKGAASGTHRMLRGGSCYDPGKEVRSAMRNGRQPGRYYNEDDDAYYLTSDYWIGFRVVRNGVN